MAGAPGAPGGGTGIDATARQHLQDAQAAAALKPGDYDALVHLGNAAFDAREFAQAVDAYEKALKLKPGDANVMTDLGTAYRNEGQADKALELFRKAHAADPANWQSLYNEVIVLMAEKQDAAGARAAFERLRKEQPSLPVLASLEQQLGAASGGK